MNDFVVFNNIRNELLDSLVPLLDKLRNVKNYQIRLSFVVSENFQIEAMKSAVYKICSDNPDILGRVDVFDDFGIDSSTIDEMYEGPVKGVTILLFLDKDKDIFDHPNINRFYIQYPQFYTGIFNKEDTNNTNDIFSDLLYKILYIQEKFEPFDLTAISLPIDKIEFVSEVVDKIEIEGLKCKVIKKNELDRVFVYFFMYETECEEMNKVIEVLKRRNFIRLVK